MFKNEVVAIRYFRLAFLIKIAAGLCFVFIYSSYYQNREEADVFKYFDDAKHIEQVRHQSSIDYLKLITGFGDTRALTKKYLSSSRFWDKSPTLPFLNDNRFIIRYHAALLPISNGNIYLHLVIGIIFSFYGLSLLFNFFIGRLVIHQIWIFIVIYFTPSIVFWSSSILKENFLILAIGLLFTAFQNLHKPLRQTFFLSTGLMLLALSKVYVLFMLIPALTAFIWSENKKDAKNSWRYVVTYSFFLGLALNASLIDKRINVPAIIAFKQSEFICLADWTGAGSQVHIPAVTDQLTSFIKASPHALYNALLRPLPWDYTGVLSIPAMIEVLLFLLLCITVLFFFKKPLVRVQNLLFLSFFFSLTMALLIGWTSPVIGAIVRYRIVYLPFVYLALLSLVDFEKLIKKFPIIKIQ